METIEHHVDLADPAGNQIAAPASSAGSAPILRQRLRDAIRVRDEADDRARAAADIAAAAASAEADAALTVEYLNRDIDAANVAATQAHAAALTTAFRTGEPLPATPVPAAVDSAALALALSRIAALRQSARELAAEADAARAEARRAAVDVAALIDEITFGEAPALALEAVAAIELHWRIIDRLTGLIALDEARPGGPRLRGFQELLVQQTNRRRAAIAEDSRLVELPNWNDHQARIVADQKRAWLDYRRRLANDSAARFGMEEEFSQ